MNLYFQQFMGSEKIPPPTNKGVKIFLTGELALSYFIHLLRFPHMFLGKHYVLI